MTHTIGGLLFVYVVVAVAYYYESRRADKAVPEWAIPMLMSVLLAALWPLVMPWGFLIRHLFRWGIVKPASPAVEWLAFGYLSVFVILLSLALREIP